MITLTKFDGQHFCPPVFRQIEGFSGPLYYAQRKTGHPYALAANSWAAVESALHRVLDDFDAFSGKMERAGRERVVAHLLQSHSAFVARVAEFTETLEKRVVPAFVPNGQSARIKSIKGVSTHVDMINNRQKHNQNFFQPITGVSSDKRSIPGFFIAEVTPRGVQRPNPEFHKGRPAFSFAIEIRATLVTAYVVAKKVGAFIEKISSEFGPVGVDRSEGLRIDLLRRVAELPIDTFPFEGAMTMPLWQFSGDHLNIRRAGGNVTPAQLPINFLVPFTPLPGALSFQPPR